MTSLVLGDLILESLTPSVNAPLRGLTHYFLHSLLALRGLTQDGEGTSVVGPDSWPGWTSTRIGWVP
jgi:hypothetical protein